MKTIKEWEILTPGGWSKFDGISKLTKSSYIKICFTDNTSLKCSENHRIKLNGEDFVYAKNIKKGMSIIGKNINKTVKSKRKINNKIDLYDLNNVQKNEEFYTNDIISHNCGLIDDATELWASAAPTLSASGGKCILLSTPRGKGSFFHKMWVESEEGNLNGVGINGFHPIKLPWNLHPERNDDWRRIEGGKQPSPREAAREFDCNFETSGDNVIDPQIIEFYNKTFRVDPLEIRGIDRGLWIWQYPDYSQTYIISADSAGGESKDFSAAHVINAITLEQCAEYKGKITTKDFGNMLVVLATEYNNALLIPERENMGYATIQAIIDRNYPNLFYMDTDLRYVDPKTQLSNKYDLSNKLIAGFSTTLKTRPLIISHLEQYFREKVIKIFSSRTLSEADTFIWKNGKAQAMSGFNDDLLISLGIGLWVRDTALRLRREGIDITKQSLNKINKSHSDQVPIYKTKQMELGRQSWQMPTGRSGYGKPNVDDLTWLIR